jgi:hypothetical protein
MTNSNLFQKIQNFPKKPEFAKKARICQKSPNLLILAFLAFFEILAFLANFVFFACLAFFGKIWISCSLHRGYRVQKSDLDDSVECSGGRDIFGVKILFQVSSFVYSILEVSFYSELS